MTSTSPDLSQLPPSDRERLEGIVAELKRRKYQDNCRKSFLAFVRHMWPIFISGRHHIRIASEFENIEQHKNGRLIINLGPRHTKSEFASVLLPAWYLGLHPDHKVIQCSVTAELAVGFGRRVRNMIDSPAYREIFPTVALQADSKAAGRWATNLGGNYFAIGVSGSVTGIGADLCIIDDPHDEQTALQAITTPEIYDKTYQWYESGPRQRLQPGGNLIIVMTRWSKLDLTAQLLEKAALSGGEKWKQISFPAILPSGKPLWPEFWSLEALTATKNAISVPKWNAQYLQTPTSDEAAIVKRTDWQRWPDDNPPALDFILQTLDTAYEKHQRADYSAIVTWGIFYRDDDTGLQQAHIILLNVVREQCEFPKLKQLVKEQYDEYNADKVIVEKKASGAPLIYELRSAGIPCSEFTPSRQTGDKTARLNAVTDLFASKRVWAPNRRFADYLIEEVASFPNAKNDDLVDCTSMALAYFRTGGFIRTDSDLSDEVKYFKSNRKMAYY